METSLACRRVKRREETETEGKRCKKGKTKKNIWENRRKKKSQHQILGMGGNKTNWLE